MQAVERLVHGIEAVVRLFGLIAAWICVVLVALVAALGSLAMTGATVWGAVQTIDWLDPARAR